jgi:hypothetical protein
MTQKAFGTELKNHTQYRLRNQRASRKATHGYYWRRFYDFPW